MSTLISIYRMASYLLVFRQIIIYADDASQGLVVSAHVVVC